jgi:DNA-binding IclR family transcriptional regulator
MTISIMNTAAYVLRAAASQHERGGAEPALLRDAVDLYERVRLDDAELSDAITRLEQRGLIKRDGKKYQLSARVAAQAPRTAAGAISIGRARCESLAAKLLESAPSEA